MVPFFMHLFKMLMNVQNYVQCSSSTESQHVVKFQIYHFLFLIDSLKCGTSHFTFEPYTPGIEIIFLSKSICICTYIYTMHYTKSIRICTCVYIYYTPCICICIYIGICIGLFEALQAPCTSWECNLKAIKCSFPQNLSCSVSLGIWLRVQVPTGLFSSLQG